MKVTYRQGRKEDCYRIAELDYIASGGADEFLYRDLIPDMSAIQAIASELEQDSFPYSYRNACVAEIESQIVGMALSFSAEYHCISEEMKTFFPSDRLEHFHEFFTTRIEGSYYLDAIAVDEKYRNKGIGNALLDFVKKKALGEGYKTLSLIVYSDNTNAREFYANKGFVYVRSIQLKPHELIPHEGGCELLKVEL